MAARMHTAWVLARIGLTRRLVDRQRIHVRAQADAGRAIAPAKHTDDTGAADAAMDLNAPFRQLGGNQIAGAMLLEADLWMNVDVTPNGGQFIMVGANSVDSGHQTSFQRICKDVSLWKRGSSVRSIVASG